MWPINTIICSALGKMKLIKLSKSIEPENMPIEVIQLSEKNNSNSNLFANTS